MSSMLGTVAETATKRTWATGLCGAGGVKGLTTMLAHVGERVDAADHFDAPHHAGLEAAAAVLPQQVHLIHQHQRNL